MRLKTVLIFLALVSVVSAADKALIDRQEILADSENVTTETFPNAEDVILDDYTQVRYEPDGTAVEVSEGYIKILTEKSRRENQTQSYQFTAPYNEIEVNLIEIIKPDGTVVEVDAEAEGKVMTNRSQMSSNIYNPNDKIYQVSVAGVEKGDILHTLVTTKTVKPRMKDSWSDYQVFEYTSPIRNLTYEIYAPKGRPLMSVALKDEIPETVNYTTEQTEERLIHKWTVSDVDMIYPEPDMPPFWTVVQRLLVSTNPSWQSVSRWYWNLCEPHLEANDEMTAKSEELISGIDDKFQQIKAIFKFVSQEIRYLGITVEKEAPGYEPHDASMTFANRHGVCRDKAALLVAMLRAVGFEAYPVLIYSGPKKDEEVPQPYFNHAISAVRGEDGEFILMDSTDESTQELLPAYLNDCSYLVATPEGTKLLVSDIEPAQNNMMRIETEAELLENGRYKAASTLKFEGINDNAYRGFFLRNSAEQRRQYFESIIESLLPGASLIDFKLTPENLQDTSRNLTAKISYEADNAIMEGGELSACGLYKIGAKAGIVNFVIGKTGLLEREFPLETGFACGVEETYNLKLSDKLEVVSMPAYDNIDTECLSWNKNLQKRNDTITSESEFKIKTVRFSPEQYLTLKENLADIERNNSKKVILNTLEATPDAVVEHNDTHYSLTDANNWKTNLRIRARVLTYKGKKDLSEIKLNFNPAWEKLQITSAQVETDGEVKKISEDEINVMDAGWAGSAPRYPAAKTLVASLPGVEVGSVIEYEVEKISKDKPFFAVTEVFGDYYPIKRKTVRLTAPADLEIKTKVDHNGLLIDDTDKSIIQKTNGTQTTTTKTLEWKCTNIEQIKRESSQPPLSGISPVLKISTGSRKEYISRINDTLEKLKRTREARVYPKKAEEITQNADTKVDEMKAIRDYIAENIRLVPARFTKMPLKHLTKPDKTLAGGYGNYMDRALLTASMLHSRGFDVSIVLASEDSRIKEFEDFAVSLADTDTFTKALVKVSLDGQSFYLNDTDQYDAIGTTPSVMHQAISLETGEIKRITVDSSMESRLDNHYRINVDSEGNVLMSADEKSYGMFFGTGNKKYAEMPPEQTRRHYQELLGEISQTARAEEELVTDFENYPGTEQYSLKMDSYARKEDGYLYFEVPPVLPEAPVIREDYRQSPYYNDGFTRFESTATISLPDGYEPIILPESGEKTLPGIGKLKVKVNEKEDSVELVFSVNLEPFVIMADECDIYSEAVSWLRNTDKRFIMLEKAKINQ